MTDQAKRAAPAKDPARSDITSTSDSTPATVSSESERTIYWPLTWRGADRALIAAATITSDLWTAGGRS